MFVLVACVQDIGAEMMDEKSLLSYNWYHQLEIPCSVYFETHKFCLMFEPEDTNPVSKHSWFVFVHKDQSEFFSMF